MKRILLAAFLGAIGVFFIHAQDVGEPPVADSPLRLPDTESEVRSVLPGSMEAPLPPLPAVPPPEGAPPLPAVGELAVPESAYKAQASPEEAGESERGETVVDAQIGTGIWSAVAAKLSLYRPGTVSYGLGFAHESADGFAFHDAGEGYSLRRSSVNARVDGAASGGAAWAVSAAFSDESDGLQGRSADFSAVSHRYLDGRASYERPLGVFGVRTSLDATLASRSLERAATVDADDGAIRELFLAPRLGLDWERGKVILSIDGSYDLRSLFTDADISDDPIQRIRGELSAKYEWSPSLVLGTSVGVASSSSFPFLAPFSLQVEAGIGGLVAFSGSGGLASDGASLAAAWRENPYLEAGEALPDDARWFARSRVDLFGPKNVSFRLGADWARSLSDGGRLVPIAPSEGSTRALYAYAVEEYEPFTTPASVRKRFGAPGAAAALTIIGFGWAADWLDEPVLGEAQRLTADLEFRGKNEAYGGSIDSSVGFSADGFELPVVDLGGFIRFNRTVRFLLDFSDIAAAFGGSDGREKYDPYLSAGFRADARIQISL